MRNLVESKGRGDNQCPREAQGDPTGKLPETQTAASLCSLSLLLWGLMFLFLFLNLSLSVGLFQFFL